MEDTSTEEDIESLIEGLAYIPGHFHLPLHLNEDVGGSAALRHRDTQLKRESLRAELEVEAGELQYAVRNMLGFLAYHLDEMEAAEEAFRRVCQESPGNLNAWANLAHVYERLGCEQEQGECLERVAVLMGTETDEGQAECRLRTAQCLAEQAFAHPHDVDLGQDEDLQERLTAALALYNRALHYGGDLGIKLATDDAFTLNQLANVFFWSGKYEMAIGICNMALTTLPDPELNWQAYCTRAKLKVTGYVKSLERAKQSLEGSPDRQDLKEAHADLKQVLSVRPCLRTHLEMGQVFYYMGVDALQESLMVDEMAVNQALVSLAQALQCPLGTSLPELQLLRGRCLLLKGEEQNAIDCFRRALELERPGNQETVALSSLLCALLDSFLQNSADLSRCIDQLEECVQQAEGRLGAGAVKTELRRLCRERTEDVAELSRELVKRGKLGMVRRLLQTLQPPGKPSILGRSLSV
ncbi:hypothetical protein P4O66_009757 [Electrophorus voltai]|uniref:Tetratricopeptide repeat domain 22 n=1 Tax=Electrophorus voltai TaxID=2609070 RepID=A0AAD9DXI9_9TELE|nr:hypothetical protein P4O66_009757 [Electrophorus voltai]